jgi:hypothetical protein
MAMDRGAEVMADDAVAIDLGFTEAELTELALSSPMARAAGSRWRLPVVLVIVAAFVIIEAFGLCSTFGQIVPA